MTRKVTNGDGKPIGTVRTSWGDWIWRLFVGGGIAALLVTFGGDRRAMNDHLAKHITLEDLRTIVRQEVAQIKTDISAIRNDALERDKILDERTQRLLSRVSRLEAFHENGENGKNGGK